MVKLGEELFLEFFVHFRKHFLIVLLGHFFIKSAGLIHDGITLISKLLNYGFVALLLKLLYIFFDFSNCLVLELIAPVVCDHFPLTGQVQFFLTAYHSPSLLHKDWHAVHGHVRLFLSQYKEGGWVGAVKPLTKISGLLCEGLSLENFVRHHREIELEEVFGLRVCALLWFVDLAPNLLQIFVNHFFYFLKRDSAVVVSQNEEEFFG